MIEKTSLRTLAGVLLGLTMGFATAIILGSLSPAGFSGITSALVWVYTNQAPLLLSLSLLGPIACSAIGLSVAYRASFITIGAEGQMLLGAIVTLWFLEYTGLNLNPYTSISLAMLLAGIFAVFLGLIPLLLRIYFNANEILTSLMLNYTILYIVNYLVSGPWRIGAFAITKSIEEEYRIGPIIVFVLASLAALIYWQALKMTRFGLMIEVYGRAPKVAETYGLNPRATLTIAALLSSLTAGIGGSLMMLGFQHNLSPMSFSPGYGYMGVLVAWLSGNNPLIALPASWFFSSILVLGRTLQASGLPIGYVLAVQSMIVLAVLASKEITAR